MVKKNLNKISGWIVLDKQSGVTSRQIVSKISETLKIKKIGHGGTLDPMATGVLPIALGEATKLISFVQKKKKNILLQLSGGSQQIQTILKERSLKHQISDQIQIKLR